MDRKRVLAAVFSSSIEGEETTSKTIGHRLGLRPNEAEKELVRLVNEGMATFQGGKVKLTPRGRKSIRVVFIGGGFEVIHYGHAYTIGKAKSLGDVLVVSVARDSTIRRRKKREPLVNERDRVKLLSSLKMVDAAILGVPGDIYVTLQKVGPDIVALGYDQYHMEKEVFDEARKRGLQVKVVRLDSPYPKLKTSNLLKEL
ncbi:MAG TPA: adenylyltransferase/cytidyltransferase family protein [Nitrososphaerales archaeon]|nr:adenylyltransferase/cytidyltransferase family protein [Nitrososphaerales archaeon]